MLSNEDSKKQLEQYWEELWEKKQSSLDKGDFRMASEINLGEFKTIIRRIIHQELQDMIQMEKHFSQKNDVEEL